MGQELVTETPKTTGTIKQAGISKATKQTKKHLQDIRVIILTSYDRGENFPKPENLEIMEIMNNIGTNDPKIKLTERENEVLKLLVQGKSNTEIAQELIVSVHTAKAHVCSILQKLCVDDRVQAAVKAIKEGLVKV